MLPISILIMIFLIGQSEDVIGYIGAGVCVVQLIPLIGTIFVTETALKKNFD